jgi:hypothetical protein
VKILEKVADGYVVTTIIVVTTCFVEIATVTEIGI